MHAAAAQQAHDQVGHARFAPVVVQRHDVRMLEPRDQLRFGLEAADEVGVIGVLRQDDLDGDFALDERLHRPIDRAERIPRRSFRPGDSREWRAR